MEERFIKKRNGEIVKFIGEKITNAILKAFDEENYQKNDVMDEVENILKNISEDLSLDSVEKIQDRIEELLMKEYPKVAKSYILYRYSRNRERKFKRSYDFLSSEFLNQYKHLTPPLTQVGMFTFLRTYSRFLPELGRRENYLEACARTVDANFSFIYKIKKLTDDEKEKYKKEAELLFDNMFNGRQYLSGRLFWVGGTKNIDLYPSAIYNCSFTKIEDFKDFTEVMYLLSLGCGVGYRIFDEDVENLYGIRKVEVYHAEYNPVPKKERLEYTEIVFDEDTATIKVGDSKIGWCMALEKYFELITHDLYRGIKSIVFNYDSVRPFGEPLKTFGGRASGHEALKTMLQKIAKITQNCNGKLKAIDCLDILGAIAQGIVVGGVRRSAMICLLGSEQEEVKTAKAALYNFNPATGKWEINKEIDHRTMSNNSIVYLHKPTYEEISEHIDIQRYNGEPAMINGVEAKRRFKDFSGINPCAEILLASKQFCNLTTVNVKAFYNEKTKEFDLDGLLLAQKLSARAGYRMTLPTLELKAWDKNQKKHRLTGCSLTGYQDLINLLGWQDDMEKQKELLKALRKAAHNANEEYARELGLNLSTNVTALKPEGTLSLLPTVSSGVHYSHSPYYIRRIRISAKDPLLQYAKDLGYPIFSENYDDESTIKVIEFPVKAPEGLTKDDVSALKQLEIYKMFQENYTDQNTSITVHVRDNEWDDVKKWLYENWDSFVGISFLSYDNSFYPLLPYEKTTKEDYEKRSLKCRNFSVNKLKNYEDSYEEYELESDCEGGQCPVR